MWSMDDIKDEEAGVVGRLGLDAHGVPPSHGIRGEGINSHDGRGLTGVSEVEILSPVLVNIARLISQCQVLSRKDRIIYLTNPSVGS